MNFDLSLNLAFNIISLELRKQARNYAKCSENVFLASLPLYMSKLILFLNGVCKIISSSSSGVLRTW